MLPPSKLTPFDAIDRTMEDRYNTHLILLYFRLFGVSSTVYPSGIKLLCLGTFFNSRYFIWILLNDSKFINVCCWSFLSFTLFKVRIDAFAKKKKDWWCFSNLDWPNKQQHAAKLICSSCARLPANHKLMLVVHMENADCNGKWNGELGLWELTK